MIFDAQQIKALQQRLAVHQHYLADEAGIVNELIKESTLDKSLNQRISENARILIQKVRLQENKSGLDAFMHEYDLSSREGVILMCLAEALLRIPDSTTADRLIQDKLGKADWQQHLGQSQSWFVNASTWGLMLTGQFIEIEDDIKNNFGSFFSQLITHSGEPVIRSALKEAMRILGHQFVMGRTIEEAQERSRNDDNKHYRYSFDMLGEAALTQADAQRYFDAYMHAIDVTGQYGSDNIFDAPGISVKLSALHPRFDDFQYNRVMSDLVPSLKQLALYAKKRGIGITIDAEETHRLDITLAVFEAVFISDEMNGWEGLGIAVQAYQKRALDVITWLAQLALSKQRRIMIRLVKGAYWDTEIKQAQEQGLTDYPIFTRKVTTDVSYQACMKKILEIKEAFLPQFATHNAHTAATVLALTDQETVFEFQRLHGMGETLYKELLADHPNHTCRVYAPVGEHAELLPYLVRRLLENGANTSFVNRIEDINTPVESLAADPVNTLTTLKTKPHPKLPNPIHLFGSERKNSQGINFHEPGELSRLSEQLDTMANRQFTAAPIINGKTLEGPSSSIINPADKTTVGFVTGATPEQTVRAFECANTHYRNWSLKPVTERANILRKAADLIETNRDVLMFLCVKEGGRLLPDALAEVREAVDFCRYYALQAEKVFSMQQLPGPTGEQNNLRLTGRGVFVCISPWNFPLAIFTGQIAAALVSGNAVVAKPAAQTPLVAMQVINLLFEAGIPKEILHLLPGNSSVLGDTLITHPALAGVAFTGSTETARNINKTLSQRQKEILPLIAETGGQNAMIVDSSALPQQVVTDVITSAFNSSGQRCSALRVLFLQEDVADHVIEMLRGAMAELIMGDPELLSTDVGPVIDEKAKQTLESHIEKIRHDATLLYSLPEPKNCSNGFYVTPALIEIDNISLLDQEVFGPILHVVRYKTNEIDTIINDINKTNYGLTLGIHSRIDNNIQYIIDRVNVGNIYVNRSMIGAVVGVQPFGGEGLSGTGPKAGGPDYLRRFATERSTSVNTTAMGGNASLLTLMDDEPSSPDD